MKKYQIIYADPPWQYTGNEVLAKNSRLNKNENYHYQTLPLIELKKIPIPQIADNDCLLFMWAVSPMLDDAIDLMKSWGFNFGTVAFVWNKIKTNPGYYTLSSCELCLVGKKGRIPQPRGSRNVHQFFSASRLEHSRKPEEIRNRISAMFPDQQKIELFARERVNNLFGWDEYEGWDLFGNEVKSDIELK